ncbi:MAG: glycosyltransferase family 9 protein [Planctomycetota bacterium]|jgi:heptosyltransferase-2|nr:glycosyltransferase family 9 protein [Planctomycetota bacterium]MDP6941377.1 glycosyltransferase family 9 protein [Planctomycetota bacterium]
MDRIGVRLPNPVGDVVAATPFIRLLKQRHPEDRIVLIGSAKAIELLDGLDTWHEAEAIEDSPSHGKSSSFDEATFLKHLLLDQIYLLPNSFSSALSATIARIPVRIGRRAPFRRFLLTRRLPKVGKPRPMTRVYSEMIGEVQPPKIELGVTERGDRLASETLKGLAEHGIHPPFLAVAPGAAFGPSKVYPCELMAKAVQLSAKKTGLQPVYFGAPEESELIRSVKSIYPAPFLHASLSEMKSLFRECKALLSMDSGARHIAAALNLPQVILYGPTDPRWTNFEQEMTVALRRKDLSCSPCHKKQCPTDHACMKEISPEEISEAVTTATQKGKILSF